ncbi:MAG: hypothetical protein R2883_03265 [Caldisericia bacterium]
MLNIKTLLAVSTQSGYTKWHIKNFGNDMINNVIEYEDYFWFSRPITAI